MKIKSLTTAFLLAFAALNAQTTQVIDISTGVQNGGTSLLPVYSFDDTWTCWIPGGSSYNPVRCASGNFNAGGTVLPGSWGTTPNARFLSPYVDGSGNAGDWAPAGLYKYLMNFTPLTCTPTNAVLTLTNYGGDNYMTNINVNGHWHSIYGGYATPLPSSFTVNITADLVAGSNNLLLFVDNSGGYTGMLAYGNITITYSNSLPTPTITGNNTFCANTPLSFTGACSAPAVSNHYWEIVESDASGNVVSGGYSWNNWYTGSPGNYTFPVNPPCGKYYKVKLAVQNSCAVWSEASKVIYINCAPVANAGSDITICKGSCADIGEMLMGRFLTYQWTSPSGVIGTGPMVHVCPTTTTTYTYTVTSTLTGCSSSDAITVTVADNDPSFSTFINTANPSYFTVQITANNTAAYSISGFYYDLKIQELDGSGSPYYTDNGTDAWWYFPSNDFKGFVSTGTGTFTQVNWWTYPHPAAGTFLYGHTYKITRTTWNDYCPQQIFYTIITPVRNMSTGDLVMTAIPENSQIPEGVDLTILTSIQEMENINMINIYPNPGKGVFSIEMDHDVQAFIEVYDALGKKVRSFEHSGFKSTIDLSGAPKGIYMINILSEGKLTSKKVILE